MVSSLIGARYKTDVLRKEDKTFFVFLVLIKLIGAATELCSLLRICRASSFGALSPCVVEIPLIRLSPVTFHVPPKPWPPFGSPLADCLECLVRAWRKAGCKNKDLES